MFDNPHTFLLDDTPESAETVAAVAPPMASPDDAVLLDAYSRTVSEGRGARRPGGRADRHPPAATASTAARAPASSSPPMG